MSKILNSRFFFGNSNIGFGNIRKINQLGAAFVGLLDMYPNAAAAYSIRLLSGSYSGALVEIRRSSDNALKSFYPDANNELSLSSEDGVGTSLSSWIGSDNGFVRTWFDQSGNSRDAQQTTAANQPLIITSGALNAFNSKPSADFASAKFMPNGLASTAPTDYTASFVRIINSYPSTFRTGFNYKTSGITYNSNGGAAYGFGAHLFKNSTTVKSDDYPTVNGQAIDFIVNLSDLVRNQVAATLSAGGGYSAGISAIGSWSNTSQTFEGEIQELVIWESNQLANQVGIEANINDYFLIY